MDSMILGRYIPGDSIVHRLDPRSKLLAMMLLILIVFWANNPLTNLILFIATGIFIALSGVSLSFFIQGLKSMFFLIAFTTIFQLFFISNGNVLFEFSFVRITDYALQQAGIIFCRFVLIIFFSTLLTLTTMPLSLASAVEALLAPLKRVKVPVHEIGLMLSMSLRFVPTLMDYECTESARSGFWRRKYYSKSKGDDSYFDSSFCNKFKTCGFLGYRHGSAWLSGWER